MKILHVENTAGIAAKLAEAMKKKGHTVHVLETWRGKIDFPHDYDNYYNPRTKDLPVKLLKTALLTKQYDVVHLHAGFNKDRFDYILSKLLYNRPFVAHYHGSESRMGYGMYWQGLIDYKIVSTPDMLTYHPSAKFIPNPQELLPYRWDDTKPRIIHMPTKRHLKGTPLILEAIEELKQEGAEFDFVLIENRPHAEAMEELAKSHILVDQVNDPTVTGIRGMFGQSSLEAMAMGKVAVCHVDQDLLSYYARNPIVNVKVDKEDLKENLRGLILDMKTTRIIGEKGRAYINDVHNTDILAKTHLSIYEEIEA